MKNILVTGGAGYIGSHTLIELIEAGHQPIVVDSLINSSEESLNRVEIITGKTIPFYQIDVRDSTELSKVFSKHNIEAVIHFAGLKSVSESIKNPLNYYDLNINTSLVLLSVMEQHNVKELVFSSSATVYGTPEFLPLTEEARTGVGLTNPYGQTKYMIEQILRDYSLARPEVKITILRYFNPIGAHESGMIGEDPSGIPNNILPYISQVAVGKLRELSVFGDDYDTADGSGVRDYIHVVDLANGHVAALVHIKNGVSIYNLGTGKGVSVFELMESFERASKKKIPYKITARRPGDIASCYADPSKAKEELKWSSRKSLDEACEDSWRWQSRNPNGYNK